VDAIYRLLKPLLFQLDAERAHHLIADGLLAWARLGPRPSCVPLGLSAAQRARLEQTLWGLRFPSPVGLAAGMDKGQVLVPAWFRLGFGFVEVGSVTPRPQPGNPRPRLFRLVEHRAVINRMGFNNDGAALVAERLKRLPRQPGPVGVNLGKNKDTPNEKAADDYLAAFRVLGGLADYVAINVSSPNTPGLRALQAAGDLAALVAAVARERDAAAASPGGKRVPLLVKLSPDEPDERLAAVAQAAVEAGADGIIATNTTLAREAVAGHPRAAEAGGLSGAPLRDRALRCCAVVHRAVGGRVPVVAAGGIATAEDAYARLRAGASLVQIYTALIFEGPEAPRRIAQGLCALLERDGLTVGQAVGLDAEKVLAG
jgi:dihydroorotate dehydrogenase